MKRAALAALFVATLATSAIAAPFVKNFPAMTGGGGGSGTVSSVQAGPGISVDSSNPAAPIVTNTATAGWAIANVRYYAVDGVNGNDANAGYSDVSAAAAGLVAKKTLAAMALIWPVNGKAHKAELDIAAGTYTDPLDFLSGYNGWAKNYPVIRGTGTNSTASSVAFAHDTAEVLYSGAVTVTGMNAAGYNPTGTPTTRTVQLLKVGGGSPAFAAEPAVPLGWRFRCDVATTTTALRNVNRTIAQVTGVDTLTFARVLPAVPVASDVCYLEEAGVIVPATTLQGGGAFGLSGLGNARNAQFIGIRWSGLLTLQGAGAYLSFSGVDSGGTNFAGATIGTEETYFNPETSSAVTVGGGFVTTAFFAQAGIYQIHKMVSAGAVTFITPTILNIKDAVVAATGMEVVGTTGTTSTQVYSVGSEAVSIGQYAMRVLGSSSFSAGLAITDSKITLGGIDFQNMGSSSAVQLNNSLVIQLASSGGTILTGSTGNTGAGMSFTSAVGGSFYNMTGAAGLNTVTGSTGDVLLSDGSVVSWSQIATTGLQDKRGNRILGAAGGPVSTMGQFSGALVTSAVGATNTYLSNAGVLSANNNTTPQLYPVSLRLATRLRVMVTSVSGTVSNSVTATVYRTHSGSTASTAITVSIPSGTTAGTAFLDSAHTQLFSDGDGLDVRLDDASSDTGAGTYKISAIVESSS